MASTDAQERLKRVRRAIAGVKARTEKRTATEAGAAWANEFAEKAGVSDLLPWDTLKNPTVTGDLEVRELPINDTEPWQSIRDYVPTEPPTEPELQWGPLDTEAFDWPQPSPEPELPCPCCGRPLHLARVGQHGLCDFKCANGHPVQFHANATQESQIAHLLRVAQSLTDALLDAHIERAHAIKALRQEPTVEAVVSDVPPKRRPRKTPAPKRQDVPKAQVQAKPKAARPVGDPLASDPWRETVIRAQAGDERAKEALLQGFEGLCYQQAQRYASCSNGGIELDDLLQEARLGVMNAVRKFDPERGVKFITFAMWDIRGACQRAAERKSEIVARPVNSRNSSRNSTTPIRIESLDTPHYDKDGRESIDELHADERVDVEREAMTRLMVAETLAKLPSVDRDILTLKVMEDRPLSEVGKMLGMSGENVRLHLKVATEKFRAIWNGTEGLTEGMAA